MSAQLHTPLLTIGQAARALGLSSSAVRRRIWRGELGAVRLGTSPAAPLRVEAEELERYVRIHALPVSRPLLAGEAAEAPAPGAGSRGRPRGGDNEKGEDT